MTGISSLEAFEDHRDHLITVAYRMLGSRADAEDAVQEAWLRWRHTDRAALDDPRAWLTTVTSRICLDQLRSARVRRETYPGVWLPEPWVEQLSAADPDPAERVTRADQVSYALLVVMERLTPEQRVALVLHDVFGVPFASIAETLSTTPVAARKLASRARAAVAGEATIRHTADLHEQRRVMAAFVAAARSGDVDSLAAVLAPDVVAIGDGGGLVPAGTRPITGAAKVARFLAGLFTTYPARAEWVRAELALVNGDLGIVAELGLPGGRLLRATTVVAIAGGRITAVFNQVNPEKLRRVRSPQHDW